MAVHKNSLKALGEELPRLTGRREEIYNFLRRHGPLTDREIKVKMGYLDMNMVRPRVTELIQMGLIEEVAHVKDASTGKTVRRVGKKAGQAILI